MNNRQARELWTSLCSPAGDQCYLDTALGSIALSHGLARRLDWACDTFELKSETLRVAEFLELWATALRKATDER